MPELLFRGAEASFSISTVNEATSEISFTIYNKEGDSTNVWELRFQADSIEQMIRWLTDQNNQYKGSQKYNKAEAPH